MAPKSANNMDPYTRAAFLAAQVDSLLSNKSHPASLPNPHPGEVAPKNPKKRSRAASPRASAVTDAKKLLRAATAVTSKSLAAPEFAHHPPDVSRHRRKCAVCRHPEREAIEDLFIHWHSPSSIANYYSEGEDSDTTWVSIYRHAYAFGLDEIRRRNLRFAFELILEQAGDITATPAAIAASARALGSCVDSSGQWNEPPRRVIVTNIIRNDVSASTDGVENDSSSRACPERSRRALHPRDVVTSEAAFAPSAPACPACPDAGRDEGRAVPLIPAPIDFVGPDRSHRAEGVHSTPPVLTGAQTSSTPAQSIFQPTLVSTAAAKSPQNSSASSCSPSPVSKNAAAPPIPPAPPLATHHSPLATAVSNRHTPEIKISPNSHKTNPRRISNRHISRPVSPQLKPPQKEKLPRTTLAPCKDNLAG